MPTEEISYNEGVTEKFTAVEQAVDVAREQANEAADAFRKGEFTQDTIMDNNATQDDRLIALLAYIIPFIMSVIILLSESGKKRPFQRYHAVQSLGLITVFSVLGISVTIGVALVQIIPVIGMLVALLVICLSPIAIAMALTALAYYGYQAYQGKRFAIPGLTSFLQDQGWLNR